MRGRRIGVWLLVSALAGAADAQISVPAAAGEGLLRGTARLRVKHCPRGQDAPLALAFALESDGQWSADAPVALAGTSSSRFKLNQRYEHPRVMTRLVLSGASLAALEALLASDASARCGEPVAVAALSVRQALLVIDKHWTRAKLHLELRAQAAAASGPRKLRYRVTAPGSWLADE